MSNARCLKITSIQSISDTKWIHSTVSPSPQPTDPSHSWLMRKVVILVNLRVSIWNLSIYSQWKFKCIYTRLFSVFNINILSQSWRLLVMVKKNITGTGATEMASIISLLNWQPRYWHFLLNNHDSGILQHWQHLTIGLTLNFCLEINLSKIMSYSYAYLAQQ